MIRGRPKEWSEDAIKAVKWAMQRGMKKRQIWSMLQNRGWNYSENAVAGQMYRLGRKQT